MNGLWLLGDLMGVSHERNSQESETLLKGSGGKNNAKYTVLL